jgi:LSD1 subclass zinc finger protein
MYAESQPYGRGKKQMVLVDELPADEVLSSTCSICGEMLQYKRKDSSVQCHYCKAVNLPVVVGESRT